MKEKRNIHELIVKEAPSLNNLLDVEDVKEFKALTEVYPIVPAKKIEKSWWKIMKSHYDVFFPARKEFQTKAQNLRISKLGFLVFSCTLLFWSAICERTPCV